MLNKRIDDLNNYGQGKERSSLLGFSAISLQLQALNYPKKSLDNFLRCGKTSGEFFLSACNCGIKKIPITYNCNLSSCERCSPRRIRRIRKKYLPIIRKCKLDRTNILYFLTVSPENYKDLEFGLWDITRNFNAFLRRRYIKDRIRGAIYVIEATKNEDEWNLHIHAIVYGRYIDHRIRGFCRNCKQSLLKYDKDKGHYYCANSKCLTRNIEFRRNSKIVNIWRSISKREVNIHIQKQWSRKATLNYMLKYISMSKTLNDNVEDVALFIKTMYRKRQIRTIGFFYGQEIIIPKHICSVCKKQIHYIFDFQVNRILNEAEIEKRKPPSPQIPLTLPTSQQQDLGLLP